MLQRMCRGQHVGHSQAGEDPKHKVSMRDYMSQLTWSLKLTEFWCGKVCLGRSEHLDPTQTRNLTLNHNGFKLFRQRLNRK